MGQPMPGVISSGAKAAAERRGARRLVRMERMKDNDWRRNASAGGVIAIRFPTAVADVESPSPAGAVVAEVVAPAAFTDAPMLLLGDSRGGSTPPVVMGGIDGGELVPPGSAV